MTAISRLSPRRAAAFLPFGLVVISLLASVAVPARQTWLITDVLHETKEVLEPALRMNPQLHSSLADELAASNERIRTLEHFSLVSNAVLVFVALAALFGVMVLTTRERRLSDIARKRARHEEALREAAEALAGAFTMDDVTQRIVQAALETMEGRGAFVEEVIVRSQHSSDVVVRAISGTGVPSLDSRCDFNGSYTEQVTVTGQPLLINDLRNLEYLATVSAKTDTSGAAIVVPLGDPQKARRALFVLSHPRGHFRAEDVERAEIFGHLAALAYEKIRLLESAYEGRRTLERVLQSRSRLIRGFTHDVKNPVGAADGYAELLSEGIYGNLSSEQRESVARIRRCIHEALSLIDDLNALARAESGNVIVSLESVDVPHLMQSICEEYQAAAESNGLSLSLFSDSDLPTVESSPARLRQIASNLLSNAIKYTNSGSVTIRVLMRRGGPFEPSGDWVVVEFIDTGPGIALQKQEFIFEEFSRIDGSNKPGAGLGLAISRLLAEALGGHITIESEIGRGSTFTLWLPLHSDVEGSFQSTPLMVHANSQASGSVPAQKYGPIADISGRSRV